MTKLSRPILSTLIVLQAVMSLFAAVYAQADKTSEPKVKVGDKSFKCITDMTPVRHFYVDNLLGNVEATVAVATVGNREPIDRGAPQATHNDTTAELKQPIDRQPSRVYD